MSFSLLLKPGRRSGGIAARKKDALLALLTRNASRRLLSVLAVLLCSGLMVKKRTFLVQLHKEVRYGLKVLKVMLQSIWLSTWSKPMTLPHGLTDALPYDAVYVPGLTAMGRTYPAEILGTRAIVAQLSPYASSHDRAVELFFMLKGGQVDYGEEHSRRYGHSRYGKTWPGRLPNWSELQPVVLIAHSHGGNTARMLQYLLSIAFFPGHATSSGWIKAVICVASPLNGCPVLHGLGMPLRSQSKGGLMLLGVEQGQKVGGLLSLVRAGQTAGYILHWALGDYEWARRFYDWGLDHWRLTRRTGGWMQLWHLVWGDHHILNTDDTAGYDLTVDGSARLNELMATLHSDTYYFSLPCTWTCETGNVVGNRPLPRPTPTFSLVPFGALIASCTPDAKPTDRVSAWSAKDWEHNDTVVPLRSQLRPQEGLSDAQETSYLDGWNEGDPIPAAGMWHVMPTSEVDHRAAMYLAHPLDEKMMQVMRILIAAAKFDIAGEDWLVLGSTSGKGL
mmetsp:Transcript_51178/g.119968  ORF Transcript_51178/g.119968 Transcript_51178/m.119968 type:complete len:505 (+) Transcript_51178:88-1602(+)